MMHTLFGKLPLLIYFCQFNSLKVLQAIKVKERIPIPRNLITVMAVLFGVQGMNAQCAMCRAVVEQGGEEMAEGINSGIVYLMAFPYLVVAVSMFLFYRNWKKTATAR